MSKVLVRPLEDSEYRAAYDLARLCQHNPPVSDGEWGCARSLYEPGLALGAFVHGNLVGTCAMLPSAVVLPGGASILMAAATAVGVRPDHTRRGVFTALQRERFDLLARRGYPLVGNLVSEATIYGRYGFGVATRSRAVRVPTRDARLRPDAPDDGEVRLVDRDCAVTLLPRLYEQLGPYRPGLITRPSHWWQAKWQRRLRGGQNLQLAVHSGTDGEDGFAVYQTRPNSEPGSSVSLMVTDFHASNPAATAGLWRFLLGLDLVDEVCVRRRPTDELVEGMLVDWRACRTHSLNDDLWIRLRDIPAALAARQYGDGDPVVIEVNDEFLPANSGRYRISPDGVAPTSEPAQLGVDADALAMAYLGTVRPSMLAGLGRMRVADPAATAQADRLFGTGVAPFCGTVF